MSYRWIGLEGLEDVQNAFNGEGNREGYSWEVGNLRGYRPTKPMSNQDNV